MRHGIDPSEEGGHIASRDPQRQGDRCRIRVADSGVGLQGFGSRPRHRTRGAARATALVFGDAATLQRPRARAERRRLAELEFPAREAGCTDGRPPDRPDRGRRAAAARGARTPARASLAGARDRRRGRNGREARAALSNRSARTSASSTCRCPASPASKRRGRSGGVRTSCSSRPTTTTRCRPSPRACWTTS